MKEIYLIGLGAIGAMVAAKLQDAGKCSLKVIVDSARRERYTREGIFVNNKKYAFNYISPDERSMPADLVIAAVKNYNLKEAIEGMRPFIGKNTSIMSLLRKTEVEAFSGTIIRMGNEYGVETPVNQVLYKMLKVIENNYPPSQTD